VAVASAGPYANLHLVQTDSYASILPLSFLQAGCPSCCPTNSVKALKAFRKYPETLQGAAKNTPYKKISLFSE